LGKFGLAAIGIAAIGLYLLLGDDETPTPEPAGTPPLSQQDPAQPTAPARRPSTPRPDASAPERERDQYAAPGGYAPPAGQGYGYPPSQSYSYAPGGGYPTTGPAQAPGYQFRPLRESEKKRLDQQSASDYATRLDPYRLPPRDGPGLAGMPRSGYPYDPQGPGPSYSANQNTDPYYAPPPASEAYPPSANPYVTPQPPPAYRADGWPGPNAPDYPGASPYSTQPPGADYGFRPLDSGQAERRWRDSYSNPPREPQRRPSGNHRSPDWPPTAPGQRGTSADAGPLWAARGFWN
jgi:hypothetical protein